MVRIFTACVAGLLASIVLAAPLSSSLKSSEVADVAVPQAALSPETNPAPSQSPSESSADAGSASKEKEGKKGEEDGAGKKDKDKDKAEDGDDGMTIQAIKLDAVKWTGGDGVKRYSASRIAVDAGRAALAGSKPKGSVKSL